MPGSRSRSTPLLRFPVFVSWFLACVPGSPLVRAWRDEFMRLQQFADATQYIASLRRDMVDMQHISRCRFGATQVWSRRVSSVRSVCERRPVAVGPPFALPSSCSPAHPPTLIVRRPISLEDLLSLPDPLFHSRASRVPRHPRGPSEGTAIRRCRRGSRSRSKPRRSRSSAQPSARPYGAASSNEAWTAPTGSRCGPGGMHPRRRLDQHQGPAAARVADA